jgi:hypothetical protein
MTNGMGSRKTPSFSPRSSAPGAGLFLSPLPVHAVKMVGAKPVHNPIPMTNMLLKSPELP